jgi:hypothetical protein
MSSSEISEAPDAMYAVVQDVPASWHVYLEQIGPAGAPLPEGLLFHLAGPTDEGFRLIEVWESESAAARFHDERFAGALDRSLLPRQSEPTIRHLLVQSFLVA